MKGAEVYRKKSKLRAHTRSTLKGWHSSPSNLSQRADLFAVLYHIPFKAGEIAILSYVSREKSRTIHVAQESVKPDQNFHPLWRDSLKPPPKKSN